MTLALGLSHTRDESNAVSNGNAIKYRVASIPTFLENPVFSDNSVTSRAPEENRASSLGFFRGDRNENINLRNSASTRPPRETRAFLVVSGCNFATLATLSQMSERNSRICKIKYVSSGRRRGIGVLSTILDSDSRHVRCDFYVQ